MPTPRHGGNRSGVHACCTEGAVVVRIPVVVVVVVIFAVVFLVVNVAVLGGGNGAKNSVLQHRICPRATNCGALSAGISSHFLCCHFDAIFDQLPPFAFIIFHHAPPPKKPAMMSAVRHPYAINGMPLETSPAKPADLFAVVGFSGTQFKVTVDDVIVADRIEGIDIGQTLDLSNVLLVGSRRATVVGRPVVAGAKVVVAVEEITKDKKVIAFKTRRRKHSRRLKGFRREVTVLRVADIVLGDKMSQEELASLL